MATDTADTPVPIGAVVIKQFTPNVLAPNSFNITLATPAPFVLLAPAIICSPGVGVVVILPLTKILPRNVFDCCVTAE